MIDKLPRRGCPSIALSGDAMTLAYEPPPGEADAGPFYEALLTALSETARGRAFLAEFARRNRAADTETLLAALARLEGHIAHEGAQAERLRDDLRMLLIAIRLARPEIEEAEPGARAAKLGKLVDMLDDRIAALAGETSAAAAPAEPAQAVIREPAPIAVPEAAATPAAKPAPQTISADPLAPLMALSEAERLALFT
jgi:hypothetical protein